MTRRMPVSGTCGRAFVPLPSGRFNRYKRRQAEKTLLSGQGHRNMVQRNRVLPPPAGTPLESFGFSSSGNNSLSQDWNVSGLTLDPGLPGLPIPGMVPVGLCNSLSRVPVSRERVPARNEMADHSRTKWNNMAPKSTKNLSIACPKGSQRSPVSDREWHKMGQNVAEIKDHYSWKGPPIVGAFLSLPVTPALLWSGKPPCYKELTTA